MAKRRAQIKKEGIKMTAFFNEFISYLLLVIIMGAVAVCGVLAGRKLRHNKNPRAAEKAPSVEKTGE